MALRVHQRVPARTRRARLYERYHIPASGAIFWGSALANIHPGKDDNWVDYKNDERAPLLFISGSDDHLMPPTIQQSNAKHYKTDASPRSRSSRARTCCPPGRAGRRSPTTRSTGPLRHAGRERGVRVTHVGGPTPLIEVGGWRLLTDPTFDAPGRRYSFGWGSFSRKLAGPAIPAAELGPIDAVLLSHDHHADNLDDAGRALLPSAGVVVTTVAGRAAARRRRARAGALADHAARGAGGDRDHGHAVPSRPAAVQAARSAT